METKVLIIGAGPSGLATAFELNKAGMPFIVVEKAPVVGGLARTLTYGDFRTDIGPHRFFSKNKYLYDLISGLLGEHWIKVDRLTRFHVRGRYLLYPVQLKDALINIGVFRGMRMLADYGYQRLRSLFVDTGSPRNFEEKVVSDFGRSLAELNMLNYTEKIWGLPCSEISPDWATQRIKNLSVVEVIKKTLIKGKDSPKTLVDQFYYPDSGTGLIYERIRAAIEGGRTGALKLNTSPSKVEHDGAQVLQVHLKDGNGDEYAVRPENLVSSMPVTELLPLFDPPPPAEVLAAAGRLKFRSHVALFLTVNKSTVFPDQWVYFPDSGIPFGRIMEPRNFSRTLAPEGKTSLMIEFFCWFGDEIWHADKEHLVSASLAYLSKIGLLGEKDLIDSFVHREKHAYPVYDLGYKANLGAVKDYFKRFRNLQLIGRAGSFRYNNQDHALEMGILAARNVLEGASYSIDDVGAEQEYFEKGNIK
ncbi:MAG: FAD-dependent oxidoreductase [Elusimicrobiales bacterium]